MNNQKNRKYIWLRLIVPVVIIIVAIVSAYSLLSGLNLLDLFKQIIKDENEQITVGFAIIMIVILIGETIYAAKKRLDVIFDLNASTESLQSNHKLNTSDIKNPALKQCFERYLKASQNELNVNVDISEYINEVVISDIIHRNITDQIANAMTGIGILGTFVGLTMGLSKFNLREMNQSTMMLIGGIKTAYYTSIFGVIASIIYNFFYQKDLEKCNIALEYFLKEYENLVRGTEIDFYSKLLEYNQRQAMAFEGFEKTLTPLLKDTVDEILNSTLKKYDKALETYIKETVGSQHKILKDIVGNFMDELTDSLDNKFDNLKCSVDNMCKWQNDTVEKLSAVIDNIENVNNITEELNKSMSDHVFAIRDSFKEGSESIHKVCEESRVYVDEYRKYREEVGKYTSEIHNGYQKIVDAVVEQVKNGSLTLKDATVESFKELQKENETYMHSLADQIYDSIDKITGDIRLYTENVKNSADNQKKYFSDSLKCIGKINENINIVLKDNKSTDKILSEIHSSIEYI